MNPTPCPPGTLQNFNMDSNDGKAITVKTTIFLTKSVARSVGINNALIAPSLSSAISGNINSSFFFLPRAIREPG